MRRLAWVSLVVLLALAWPARVAAHGDLQSADPKADSTLKRAPDEVVLVFTEEPGPGTTVKVHDGCVREVAAEVSQSGSEARVSLGDGEPGNWHVRYRSVSSVDGHTVRGTYSFFVRGKHDCSKKDESSGNGTQAAGADDEPTVEVDDQTGGGFPWVPFGIGSVVVIGLAFVLRRAAAR